MNGLPPLPKLRPRPGLQQQQQPQKQVQPQQQQQRLQQTVQKKHAKKLQNLSIPSFQLASPPRNGMQQNVQKKVEHPQQPQQQQQQLQKKMNHPQQQQQLQQQQQQQLQQQQKQQHHQQQLHQQQQQQKLQQQQQQQHATLDVGTSKLLMKSSGVGGRSSRGGAGGSSSMVHSIPKFSQVRPTEKLAEVQKVLQSRIISKQMEKRRREQQLMLMQQQQQQQQMDSLEIVPIAQSVQQQSRDSSTLSIAYQQNKTQPGFPNNQNASRRRGRKPAKEAIQRLMVTPTLTPTLTFIPEPEVTIRKVTPPPPPVTSSNMMLPPGIPVLSEVTITPTGAKTDAMALDLTKNTPFPDIPSQHPLISIDDQHPLISNQHPNPPPMLRPPEFDRLGSPAGYVFCPQNNVFVHPSALQRQLGKVQQQQQQQQILDEDRRQRQMPLKKRASRTNIIGLSTPQINSSSITNSSGKVQEPMTRKRKSRDSLTNNNEVSICKFKFTGGDRPTLEERRTSASMGNLLANQQITTTTNLNHPEVSIGTTPFESSSKLDKSKRNARK